jgi:hypothetical protein
VEVTKCKVPAVWWVGRTFLVNPGVALSHGLFGVHIVGKGHFLCGQSVAVPQWLPSCARNKRIKCEVSAGEFCL